MSKNRKLLLYGMILLMGLLVFVLEIFVFQKPDGILGLAICLVSILMIFGGVVKLCLLSPRFKDTFLEMLDILFWLP